MSKLTAYFIVTTDFNGSSRHDTVRVRGGSFDAIASFFKSTMRPTPGGTDLIKLYESEAMYLGGKLPLVEIRLPLHAACMHKSDG